MAEGSVEVDASDVVKFFKYLSGSAGKESVRALNDAAFKIRSVWRDAIAGVDNPTPFTNRGNNVLVKPKATTSSPVATIFVNTLQAEYLAYMVEGLVHKGSDDLGTIRGQIVHPLKANLNEFGNFPKSAPRWVGAIAKGKSRSALPNTFVGTPNYSGGVGGTRAVFERAEDHSAKLTLLAVFVESTQAYKETLPLFKLAQDEANGFFSDIEAAIDASLS